MAKRILLIIITLVLTGSWGFCEKMELIGVVDGDTLLLKVDGKDKFFSIYGIDAPELGQAYSEEAKNFLENILVSSRFTFKVNRTNKLVDKNSYGDVGVESCEIYSVNEKTGIQSDVSCQILMKGLAFPDKRINLNQAENSKYINSAKMAKNSRENIWSQTNIVYPWDYRKSNNLVDHEVAQSIDELSSRTVISNGEGGSATDYDSCVAEIMSGLKFGSDYGSIKAHEFAMSRANSTCKEKFGVNARNAETYKNAVSAYQDALARGQNVAPPTPPTHDYSDQLKTINNNLHIINRNMQTINNNINRR